MTPVLHLSARTALPPKCSAVRSQKDPWRWHSYAGSGPGSFSESIIRDSQGDERIGSTSRSVHHDSWRSRSSVRS